MALPILDGNQSATTLSTIITGGAHIPAHTVVSLGTQAKSDITSAISGSVVSISNFPSTQTVAGTVTANIPLLPLPQTGDSANSYNIQAGGVDINGYVWPIPLTPEGLSVPISGTVTVGNSVTIGSLPAISGTVTANLDASSFVAAIIENNANGEQLAVQVGNGNGVINSSNPLNVSGTVTAAAPNGSFTTRFGTPTTANVSFATSAVTNANRKYLLIQNVTTGSNVITVGIGFTPTTTQGIQLTAGAGITFESSYIPTGAVYVLSSVTASNFTILEA